MSTLSRFAVSARISASETVEGGTPVSRSSPPQPDATAPAETSFGRFPSIELAPRLRQRRLVLNGP